MLRPGNSQRWSERATGDAEVNRQIRNRLMYPIEIPVAEQAKPRKIQINGSDSRKRISA